MSNNWNDIGNASLVIVMGANPVENHPASIAHVNHARQNQNIVWPDGTKGARLVVIDPRKTRTALQCDPKRGDRFIRMRPGTDIAIINGVIKRILEKMDNPADTSVPADVRAKFFAFLNQTETGSATAPQGNWRNQFYTDGFGGAASALISPTGGSRYTDARFIVNENGTDYDRETINAGTATQISNLPKKAAEVDPAGDPNVKTVYRMLREHVAPYDAATVEDISGVSPVDLEYLANIWIENSRCSSIGTTSDVTAASQDPRVAGYRATTMMYAMGLTQHTCGGQNVKAFATIQTLMGNNGRAGGGINALRGIHNVQGSTDMGNLQHLIPFYSGNPGGNDNGSNNAFGIYMDNQWGFPLNGTGNRANMNGSYDDAYNTAAMGLQQRGFINMTYNFFGKHQYNPTTGLFDTWMTTPLANKALTQGLYNLWAKGNGDYHTKMFRQMKNNVTKACVVWGQNPAVTQPYQSAVRAGLKQLDLLVVVDMFETETAACDRKDGSITYLIPASSHVEEAGSVSNSGRVLQWREKASEPKGNSKADLELMFRLAYWLNDKGAFDHITTQWAALAASIPGGVAPTNAYQVLYGDRYGYDPSVHTFEDVESTIDVEIWRGADAAPSAAAKVKGSEWFAEQIYRELCTSVASGGCSWLYIRAFQTDYTSDRHANQVPWLVYNRAKSRAMADPNGTLATPGWGYSWLVNRRVLYNNGDVPGDVGDFYMKPDSVATLFVSANTGSGIVATAPAGSLAHTGLQYSRWYRFYHRLSDYPDAGAGTAADPADQYGDPHYLANRFPSHTEPYETPREDLAAVWGRNTTATGPGANLAGTAAYAPFNLVPADTPVAATGIGGTRERDPDNFPLVLTTIRCVEHFQGGPITRNNPWNVEAEPEPWVEINSVDAAAYGIKTGDYVNVTTARGGSNQASQGPLSPNSGNFTKGFIARVGVGTEANQRVGVGVVAIPWHWGDKGYSTGARANDLCIDAGDANTTIPESKACLCQIEKM